MRNLLGKLLLRCSTSCIHAVVRGSESGPKYPDSSCSPSMACTLWAQGVQIGSPADLSSHSHHYVAIVPVKPKYGFTALLLLATITLNSTGS